MNDKEKSLNDYIKDIHIALLQLHSHSMEIRQSLLNIEHRLETIEKKLNDKYPVREFMPTENKENPIHLVGNMNARVWAEEFVRAVNKNPSITTDVETMIGWFANAIMTGYDNANPPPRILPDERD
jgi:hypothetical protein